MASKYKDPATVTCAECAARSSQRVADLLALKATCPNCHGSLMQVDLNMRNGLDEWATFVAAMLMTLRLEERLETKFTDDEVYRVKALRDLTAIVAARLDSTGGAASPSIELTTWAAGHLAQEPLWRGRPCRSAADAGPPDLDAPLLDVLDPDRWNAAQEGG